jgi:3-hydroxybutyryl-CoA dehydratase
MEDIFVGQQFIFKKTISEELIKGFSELTGDYHPLHVDAEYAKKSGFENIIAQGFLVSGFLSYVVGMKLPGENALILSQESKFINPIYLNEEITFCCEVTTIDTRFSIFDLKYVVTTANNVKTISGKVKVKVRSICD